MDIFVGSIPFKIKEEQLKEVFEKYGEVESVKIVIDKRTRLNKGFAFIVMPNRLQGMKAINELDGTELMERKIIVSESTPKETKHDSYFKRKVRSRKR